MQLFTLHCIYKFMFDMKIKVTNHVFNVLGVNKCDLQPQLCAPNGECVNVNGSHICKCKIGWTGDDCRTGEINCFNKKRVMK